MNDTAEFSLNNLSGAIQRIQLNIDHINAVTEQAIHSLEEKKRDVRKTTDPNLEKIEADIENINLQHDQLLQRLVQQKTDVSLGKQSIDRLDQVITELDMEISRIQSERNRKIEELERKKSYITQRLNSVQNLHITVRNISTQIYDSMHDFDANMSEMARRKLEIEKDATLSESERTLALAKIEREIEEVKDTHDEYLKSLKMQRDESLLKVRDIDMDAGTAYEVDTIVLDEIDKLEASKIGATPSQLEEIERKLRVLRKQKEEISLLRELNERGLRMSPSGHIITGSGRILTVSEAEKAGLLQGLDISQWLLQEELSKRGLRMSPSGHIITSSGRIFTVSEAEKAGLLQGLDVSQWLLQEELNKRGLRMSPSGHIITSSGRILTVSEAEKAGLLQGLDISQWLLQEQLRREGLEVTASGNIRTSSGRITSIKQAEREGLLQGVDVQILQQQELSAAPTISNLSEETRAGLASEDVEYLKEVLGKPLTLALAEVCAKQPRDPIHYLGHWLFKYRYNQEIDEVRKNEIQQLTVEREKIKEEARQREMETAAKEAILEMVSRAHDTVLQKELEKISRAQEMAEAENEELEDEARDILGELRPAVG